MTEPRQNTPKMPWLVRLYITQCAIGFFVAALFVGMLFYANVANLWHLVTHTSAGPLAALLLWVFNGIVFSGVQFGIALMRAADTPERPNRSGGAPAALWPAPHAEAPIPVTDAGPSKQQRER